MSAESFFSPAKLNLFLHITGRRRDGYHELQTLFQLLDHGDQLWAETDASGEIRLETEFPGVEHEQNLIVRAARLLKAHTGTRLGARLRIDKRLPMGGGLGGGSSNAATTLVALNRLWHTGVDIDTLASLGLTLGADVPVFVRGHSCFAEGVGERITPVTLPERWFLVLIPHCHVSTAEVFSDPGLTRDSPKITMRTALEQPGHNDCEPVVRRRFPEVAEALDWLGRFGQARLTGTGACVFASFSNESEARTIAALRERGGDCFVAKGVNTSPLYQS